jgi:hypothetical protein
MTRNNLAEIHKPAEKGVQPRAQVRERIAKGADAGLLEAAVHDDRSLLTEDLNQGAGQLSFLALTGISEKLALAGICVRSVTMMDAELREHLLVATMAFIEGHHRCHRFEVEIVTRPLNRLKSGAEAIVDDCPS